METEIKKLLQFESQATSLTFFAIFGEDIAPHLWNKFSLKAGHSITVFVRMLDSENERKFYQYLDQSWKN